MLVISQAQMDAFSQASVLPFKREMVLHCFAFFPVLCAVLGEVGTGHVVSRAILEARRVGFTAKGPVRLFIELTFLFGSDFPSDPQYPWIRETLGDGRPENQAARAMALFRMVRTYQQQVLGPSDVNAMRALAKLRDLASQEVHFPRESRLAGLVHTLHQIYPEKVAFAESDQALPLLIEASIRKTAANRLPEGRAELLVLALMFAFGHGCFEDPLYPWIGHTVQDERLAEPGARALRLERKALTWLGRVLNNYSPENKT